MQSVRLFLSGCFRCWLASRSRASIRLTNERESTPIPYRFVGPSSMLEILDLLAAADKELGQLDSDYLRGLIPATETIRIRESLSRTAARLESILGIDSTGLRNRDSIPD